MRSPTKSGKEIDFIDSQRAAVSGPLNVQKNQNDKTERIGQTILNVPLKTGILYVALQTFTHVI